MIVLWISKTNSRVGQYILQESYSRKPWKTYRRRRRRRVVDDENDNDDEDDGLDYVPVYCGEREK